MIAAMRHNPRLLMASGGSPPAIALSLDAGIGEIQILDALDLDMQPRQRVAHHVGTVCAAGKLLSAPGVKSMLAQE